MKKFFSGFIYRVSLFIFKVRCLLISLISYYKGVEKSKINLDTDAKYLDYKGVGKSKVNLGTNSKYNLVPFMSYQIIFEEFFSILEDSFEISPTAVKYLYIFNYKGELVCVFVFRPDLIWLSRAKLGGNDLIHHHDELVEIFCSILNSCDQYVLDTNS
jgi:hypothetical protein